MEGTEQWEGRESGRVKRDPNCAKMALQEGGQEGDEYSLIAEKHRWGSKALLQLFCWIQAMQCTWGTEAPNLSNTLPSGDMKGENGW